MEPIGAHSPDKVYHGKPCSAGHGTVRYRKRGECVVCVRLKAREYQKARREQYRKNSRQKYASSEAVRLQKSEQNKRWRANPENREKVKARRSAPDVRAKANEARRLRNKTDYGKALTRGYALKHFYGLSHDQFDRMLQEQGGCCKVCKKTCSKLCVDHCHATGRVRGLLCKPCNTGIGALYESEEVMLAAIQYLRSYRVVN